MQPIKTPYNSLHNNTANIFLASNSTILGQVIGEDGSGKLLMIEQKESNTIIKWIVENVGGSQHHNQLQYIMHL